MSGHTVTCTFAITLYLVVWEKNLQGNNKSKQAYRGEFRVHRSETVSLTSKGFEVEKK